jgi:ankyrin repeat protein
MRASADLEASVMRKQVFVCAPLAAAIAIGFITALRASGQKDASPQAIANVDFERDVQPIFRQYCYGCHGPTQQKNNFRLDRRSDAMRGGTTSPGDIRPGSAEASALYIRISSTRFGPQMPPTGALAADQIAIVRAWLDQGAEWPDSLAGDAPAVPPDPRAQPLIAALRRGDAQAFAALAAEPTTGNLRGPGGSTPLMFAAAYGTAGDVKRLLEGGADPNVRNDAGATALMWAVGDPSKTRLLLEAGADVHARSADGRTPLLVATDQFRSAAIVSLLLDYGADPFDGSSNTNPLFAAARHGDEPLLRLLLDRGVDVNASGYGGVAFALKAGCRACAQLLAPRMSRANLTNAMLFAAPPIGDGRDLEFFIAHGADVNGKDAEGHTALILASASDTPRTDAIRTLLARGADVNAASTAGETALGFAQQRGHTPVVDILRAAGAKPASAAATTELKPAPAASPRAAIERALPLLQKTDTVFLKKSGCVSCHNDTLTAMAVAAARGRGIGVDEGTARQSLDTIAAFIDGWRERAYQGIGIPGESDTVSYILLGLAAEKYPADAATDAMSHFLKRRQLPTGQWQIFAHRPPLESSDIEVTAASMRALQLYAPRARLADYERSVQRAAAWLAKQTAISTEDRAFQLLGLAWGGAATDAVRKAAAALAAEQRPDGGWAQLPTLTSDAYATGQALFALNTSGAITPADLSCAKGVQYLLSTQNEDGSWLVKTRAIAVQPLFDIGFPHGRDSWISAAGTNWAVLALAAAVRQGS